MRPYYEDAAVTLFVGSCFDVLPRLDRVDHVLTDPPYEADAHTPMRRTQKSIRSGENDVIDFAAITDAERFAVAGHFTRLARGWVLVFCQVEATAAWRHAMVTAGAKYRRSMAWVKPDSSPQFNGQGPAQGYECVSASWCGDGASEWNAGGKRGVYEFNCNVGRHGGHPTEKPVPLLMALLGDFTGIGDVVVDAFAGIGSVGVAAKKAGRRAILIERREDYAEIAAKRLQSTFDLWEPSPSRDAVDPVGRGTTGRPRATNLFTDDGSAA